MNPEGVMLYLADRADPGRGNTIAQYQRQLEASPA
jgi:hypothetical protein